MEITLDFSDLKTIEIPFSFRGKSYILREAGCDAACKWRNSILKGTRFAADGKATQVENLADSEPLLVSLCCFELLNREGTVHYRPVPVQEVRGWPSKMVKKLFETAKEISELGEEETVSDIDKRIKELNEKKQKLLTEQGTAAGNGQSATEEH